MGRRPGARTFLSAATSDKRRSENSPNPFCQSRAAADRDVRAPIILACDMGGTRIKLGLVRGGKVLQRTVIPAESDKGLGPRLPVVAQAFRELLKASGTKLSACGGVSISYPSLVDPASGRILAAHGKYLDGPGIDLRGWAKRELGLPLAIENDARMALIGEWQYGAGRGCDNLAIITLGTGLGTSAIIEGQVLRGRHNQAGCFGGHLTVRYGGRRCNCGNLGCAEAEASTAFLTALAKQRVDYGSSRLAEQPILDFKTVFALAEEGDLCAKALRDQSLLVWGSLAVNLIHAYDCVRLILGGGIMASAKIILPAIRAHVEKYAHTPWGKVRVVPSQLGDDAALLAGEWLVREQTARMERR